MLPDLLEYLNGHIPLGLILIPYAGICFTMIWWVTWSGTGFWDKRRFWKVLAIGWFGAIWGYLAIWVFNRPLPMPVRVMVYAGDPQEKNPGPWAEGVAEAIKCRLKAAPEHFVVQDQETAPGLFRNPDPSVYEGIASRARVKYIIRVNQDSASLGDRPTVIISLRKHGLIRYSPAGTLSAPKVNLASMMNWAGETISKELGGKDLKGNWSGRPPNLPDSLLEVHYLAYSVQRLDQEDLAAAFFRAEADADLNWSSPRIELARLRLDSKPGLYEDEIRTTLLEATTIDRENPEPYILLGRHFLEFRDWDEAESALKLAYYFNPDDPRTLFYLTRLMDHRLTDLPLTDSHSLFARTLQLAPAYETARLGLIEQYRTSSEREKAIRIVEKGLDIDPESRPLMLTASAAYLEMKRYDEAVPLCEKLLTANPRDHEALYNLGLCRLWTKKYDEAVAAFDSSRKNGGTIENYYYAGMALQFKKDYPAALEWYRKRFAAVKRRDDPGAAAARNRIEEIHALIGED